MDKKEGLKNSLLQRTRKSWWWWYEFLQKHQDGFLHISLISCSNLFSIFAYDLANSFDNQSRPSYNPLPCTAQVAWMYHCKRNRIFEFEFLACWIFALLFGFASFAILIFPSIHQHSWHLASPVCWQTRAKPHLVIRLLATEMNYSN